jgi:hypothetical protein
MAIVKNAYRVSLTRGARGCYQCILDDEARSYVIERMATKQALESAQLQQNVRRPTSGSERFETNLPN